MGNEIYLIAARGLSAGGIATPLIPAELPHGACCASSWLGQAEE